jgi:hypothetical protein
MPKQRSKTVGGEKIFVRGADGSLYVLTKEKAPFKLKAKDAKAVEGILADAQQQIGERLKNEVPNCGSMVNIPFPHIFP